LKLAKAMVIWTTATVPHYGIWMQFAERHCDCKCSSQPVEYLTNVCGYHIIDRGHRNPPSKCLIPSINIDANLYNEKFPLLTASEHLKYNVLLGF
jgi:hypothetical protein